MKVLLNGYRPPSPELGKVGAILGPALVEAGHELVGTEGEAEVMVDFTTPTAVVANVRRALAAGLACIVGTSGWDPGEVDEAARAAGLPVLYAPNFALGAVLMLRFAGEAARYFDAAEIVELHHATKLDAPSGTALATAAQIGRAVPIHSVRLPGLVAHQEVIFGGRGETLTIRHDTSSRDAFVPGVELALARVGELPPGVTVGLDALLLTDLVEHRLQVGEVSLSLLRPREPEALLDEQAFANDEFIPYWAELWPAALALAGALPERLAGRRLIELGCGLGVPALVAAARGGEVTALDWAAEAVALLRENAARNGLALEVVHADWRAFAGSYDLALAADLLYERRNGEALLGLLPRLAPEVLLAEPGRPHAAEFLLAARGTWELAELGDRVYRLSRRAGHG